jgi:hypothetical protein
VSSEKQRHNLPAWVKVVLDFLAKIVAAGIVQVVKDWLS